MQDSMDPASNEALRALAATRTRTDAPLTPQCAHPVAVVTGPNGYPTPDSIATRAAKIARKGLNPDLCAHRSSYSVGGKPYCAHHAGIVALEALIDAGAAHGLE